jgi:hypothetical protein
MTFDIRRMRSRRRLLPLKPGATGLAARVCEPGATRGSRGPSGSVNGAVARIAFDRHGPEMRSHKSSAADNDAPGRFLPCECHALR